MIKFILSSLVICLFCFNHAESEEIKFSRKSDFYKWLEKGESSSEIDSLQLQDGWSSRNADYIHGEQFSDEDFATITLTFPELASLHLQFHERLTDASLKNLEHLPHLKDLSLKDVENVTEKGWLLIPETAPQIETLAFTGIYHQLKEDTVSEMVKNLPQLSQLQIHGRYNMDHQKWMEILHQIKKERPEIQIIYFGKEINNH